VKSGVSPDGVELVAGGPVGALESIHSHPVIATQELESTKTEHVSPIGAELAVVPAVVTAVVPAAVTLVDPAAVIPAAVDAS